MSKLKQIIKQASAGSDELLTRVTSFIPVAGPVAAIPGVIHGMMSDTDEEDLEAMNEHPGRAFIPGVGMSRGLRRQNAAPGSSKGRTLMTHLVNPLAGLAAPMLLGAAIGGIVSRNKMSGDRAGAVAKGALIGGAVSPLLTTLGYLVGLNGKPKTKAEHLQAERDYKPLRAAFDPVYNGYHIGRRADATNNHDGEFDVTPDDVADALEQLNTGGMSPEDFSDFLKERGIQNLEATYPKSKTAFRPTAVSYER